MKLFVTYGYNSIFRNKYSEVECDNFESGMSKIREITKNQYSMVYHEDDYEKCIAAFNLEKVNLQPSISSY